MAGGRRFQSTVPYYVRYRTRYPQALLNEVAGALGVDGGGRLLDLGCGPGFLAIGLAPHFEAVVAMDPEPEMIAAAEAEAAAAGLTLTLVSGGSDDLGPHLGSFRLVTMGRSFHWMARDRTLAALDALVIPGGAIGLFAIDHQDTSENAWRATFTAIRDRYTPPSLRRRWSDEEPHEAVLARSVFSVVHRLTYTWRQRVSIDDLAGRMLSMSVTAPTALGDRRGKLEAELREALAPYATGGLVEEVLEAEALLAERPGS